MTPEAWEQQLAALRALVDRWREDAAQPTTGDHDAVVLRDCADALDAALVVDRG